MHLKLRIINRTNDVICNNIMASMFFKDLLGKIHPILKNLNCRLIIFILVI